MVGEFTYFGTSERIAKGDRVRLTDLPQPMNAVVVELIEPRSESALNLGVFNTGASILRAESGDEFVCTEVDSHLELLGRQGIVKQV